MDSYLEICAQAARAGGRVLLDWRGRFQFREKAPSDLVTEADLASQHAIKDVVLGAFPEHGFLGEEGGEVRSDGQPRWIVDPLDGTMNYVHQLPNYSVSVALEHRGQLVVGAVYDPLLDELFLASAGGGATLNGSAIRVSSCKCLDQGLIAASFSSRVERRSIEVRRFEEVLVQAQGLRRLGSAALNLSYLACGRLDGYWATSVKIWDVAAGLLLLREAGGVVTSIQGQPLDLDRPYFVGAATSELHRELLEVLLSVEGAAR